MKLYKSSSRKDAKPYIFEESTQPVYSYEGFVYYCISHVNEGIKALQTESLITWLQEELKLQDWTKKLRMIKDTDTKINEQFLDFISEHRFVSENRLLQVKEKIANWQDEPLHMELKRLGDEAFRLGKYSRAIKYYERSYNISEQSDVMNNIGASYMKLHFYDSAERAFLMALKKSDAVGLQLNYMRLLKVKRKYGEALEYIKSCIIKSPNPEFYQEEGILYSILGDLEAAFEAYMKAYELDHCEKRWFSVLEASLESQGTQSILLHLEQQKPTKQAQYFLLRAKIYMKDEQIDQAIEILDQAIVNGIEDKEVYLKLIQLYRVKRQIIKAIEIITKGLKVHPVDDEFIYEMALVAKMAGNQQDYFNKIDEILRLWKKSLRNSLMD